VHTSHATRIATQYSAAARTALLELGSMRSDRAQVWLAYYHNPGTEWIKANASTRGM
jgi:hypothetical protein